MGGKLAVAQLLNVKFTVVEQHDGVLDRRTRKVLHYDMVVTAAPTEASIMSALKIARALKAASANKTAVYMRNNERAAIRIPGVAINNEGTRAVMLLHHANKDGADPVFANLETGALRMEPKLCGEGVAVSAHLFLNLEPNRDRPNAYHVLLEAIPGLSRSYIRLALRALLRDHLPYQFQDRDGSFKAARPLVTFEPRPSEDFLEDLARGRLLNATLIRRKSSGDRFDDEPTVKVYESQLKVGPARQRFGSEAVTWLNQVIGMGRDEGYSSIRVAYVDDEDKKQSPLISIDETDSIDSIFAKASWFTVDDDLLQCEPDIRKDVNKQLRLIMGEKKPAAGR